MDNTTSTKYKLESGSIKVCTYIRSDAFSNRRIRFVIQDLYQNQPEFDEPIIWIEKIIPNEGKTATDVLTEYVKADGKDAFIMCKASELAKFPKGINGAEMLSRVDDMLERILSASFYRILFNRRMSRVYGVHDICIYGNTKTEDWINDSLGEDKLIKIFNTASNISYFRGE